MRIVKSLLPALVIGSLFSTLSYAATPDRIAGALASGQTVPLKGSVHHLAQPEFDQGPVDPAMHMGTITLTTVPTAAQQKAIKQLLAQQQDRKSSNYHKWLTPEQYADRFGLSQNDMQQMAAWLKAKGFTMIHQARGRNWISFTGTAAQVQNAFGAEIHHFAVNGELHYANATPAQIPAALNGVVSGLMGMHDFLAKPMNHRPQPNYYSSGLQSQFIAPGDVATLYDINALYTAGIDGTGQKLAVMGQTDVYLADLNDFRTGFGLSSLSCTTNTSGVITACSDPHFSYVLNGTDPGVAPGDLSEADLDLEWAGAVARGAQIIYVNTAMSSGGSFASFYHAIDNNLAPVISLSYGECEFYANIEQSQGFPQLFEAELMKANSLGITFVNSSGDSGATGCDFNNPNGTVTSTGLATQGLGVSYPASSPEVTGVGGTAVQLAYIVPPSSTYWGQSNGTNGGTAIKYVPEQAWNDDAEFFQYCQQNPGTFCSTGGGQQGWVPITSEATAQQNIGISSTGGGPSNCAVQTADFSACVSGFPQPSWQTVTVSGQSTRLSPDVSFLATPNFPGYIFCTPLSELGGTGTSSSCASGIETAVSTNFSLIGGTSVSAPIFAGIVAVLNQYTASTQGNINPSLYQLAATAPGAFNDVIGADNKVACKANSPGAPQPSALWCPSTGVLGFTAGTGFDLATGLGSMDVNNFALALAAPPDFSASSPTTSLTLFAGQSGTATITVTPINNFTGSVSFACSGLPTGSTCSFNPTSVTPSGAPATTTATIQTGGSATTANVAITATTGVLSQVSHPAAAIALTLSQAFTLSAAPSFPVTQGATINPTVTVTANGGFTGPLTFTCSDPAPESICTPPPNTNLSSTPVTVSFQITTAAPTASLRRPSDHGARIFYAMLLPGLLGIMFTAGSRRRSLRGMRFLGLIMVLGFSTLWLASCGGGSGNSNSNPGTPKGSYTISVNATSGNITGTPTTFTIVVQ